MPDLPKDPKVIRAARHHLILGETVLWACAQRGLGRRGLFVVAATLLAYLAIWAAMARGSLVGLIILMAVFSPFLLWWLVEMLARSFIATDRRVIFISRLRPYRWSYWNYTEMDVHWVRFGKGRSIVHLKGFSRGAPRWVPRGAVYPDYIEHVAEIESVRELILEQIARRPDPVEEPVKSRKPRGPRGPRQRIHGTRTG